MNASTASVPAPRWLCVCADDFGIGPGVNSAIVELAQRGRISATGCMVQRDAWAAGAPELRGLDAAQLDVGLHLDLTRPPSGRGAEPSLARLIAAGYLGLLGRARLRSEMREQFARFEDGIGRAPAFVDGHRHVHQLPTVREVLLEELAARYGTALPWLRSTAPRTARGSVDAKARLIYLLGGAALRRRAARLGFATSGALLGVYDFTGTAGDYRQRLGRWVDACRSGDVLMCHPSSGAGGAGGAADPIDAARRNEYAVLRDFAFPYPALHGPVALAPLSGRLEAASGADRR